MNFLEAVKMAVDEKKTIYAVNGNGIRTTPLMFYDHEMFRWHFAEGVGPTLLPSPEQLLGEWESQS